MPRYDFQSPRLYVLGDLAAGSEVAPGEPAIHYLRNVLRLEAGAGVLAFNGRDGEWRARVVIPSKRELKLEILEQTRPQPPASSLHYAFAPVKHARLDYLVQKAVELGAGGVPAWVIDQRLLVPGAQPHEVFVRALHQLGHQPVNGDQ